MKSSLRRLLALTVIMLGCFALPAGSAASPVAGEMPLSSSFSSFELQGTSEELLHTFDLPRGERVNAVAFSPDSGILVAGTALGIHVYDLQDFRPLREIRTDVWVRGIALSPDGSLLAGALFDGTIRFWRTSDGSPLAELKGHTEWVRSVAFTADGKVLASASDDNTIRLWNVSNGAPLLVLDTQTNGVRSVAFSPDGRILAAGTADGRIHLWNAGNGALLRTLEGHEAWVRTLAFSHDGRLLASGAFDALARIWRVGDGALLHELKGHTSSVLSLAFTPDDRTLATGSVDSTVRLWNVEDGTLRTILAGHEGFVYGIAISPDGARLASGSEDHTVRVWDISNPRPLTDAHSQAGTSDCRLCHHPRGTTTAPPVLEVRCEACHPGGAVFNWCPIFPRLVKPPVSTPGYTLSTSRAGVPIPSETLSLVIASPGNGETYYVRPEFTSPLQVTGRVMSTDEDVSAMTVSLEVWSGNDNVGTLTTPLHPDGGFSFDLGINKGGAFPVKSSEQIDAGSIICDTCHTKYAPALFVPQGELRMVARVTGAGGEQATDERRVNVDIPADGEMEVRVIDADTGQPVPGISVQASTRLYEWRARTFTSISGPDGIARLDPEVLRFASTAYQVSVPRQVAGGIYYEGTGSAEVTYSPDDPEIRSAEIKVRSQGGTIHGRLEGEIDPAEGAPFIWAVRLPAGPAFSVEPSGSNFSFEGLPVGKYLLFPGADDLLAGGLQNRLQTVDLANDPEADVTLPLPVAGDVVKRNVKDSADGWIPFAWLSQPGSEIRMADLSSGLWMFERESAGPETMVLSAPGYYSQAVNANSREVLLHRRPEMRLLPWGAGEILLPPGTNAAYEGGTLNFISGWVWGKNRTNADLRIVTTEAEIFLSSGRFALALLPDQLPWFYLLEGVATVQSANGDPPRTMEAGTMIALQKGGMTPPLPYDPVLYAALHPLKEEPQAAAWEPTLSARLQKWLIELGLTTAQVVTYVTYAAVLLSIVAIPAVTISLRLRRPNRPKKTV